MSTVASAPDAVDVLVVGAGQAGLTLGHHLRGSGLRVLIVDGAERIGDSWRERWESLRLFTPRPYASPPGLPLPSTVAWYPTKDDIADHLERYAARERLSVRLGTRIDRLEPGGDVARFLARTADDAIAARHVVVATGPFHRPAVPGLAAGLAAGVWQRHSRDYRVPEDVPVGRVLVVGGGNSGAQIAVELVGAGREVTWSTSGTPWFLPQRLLGIDLYRWLSLTRILTADRDAAVSRLVRRRGDAIIGTEARQLIAAGALGLRPRLTSASGREAGFADGTREPVGAVVWATGFAPDHDWIHVGGALDAAGRPVHRRGASPVAGLHWLGLPWQHRLDSSILHGFDHDARVLARVLRGAPDGTAPQPAAAAASVA